MPKPNNSRKSARSVHHESTGHKSAHNPAPARAQYQPSAMKCLADQYFASPLVRIWLHGNIGAPLVEVNLE